jgi:hypothetical protein
VKTEKGLKIRPAKALGLPTGATYTPDYGNLIQQDPAFSVLKQQLSAQGTQDAAQRQQAINQALIQYGGVPNFGSVAGQLGLSPSALQQLMGDIDPHTAGLAQQNTAAGLSTQAQLQHQQEIAIRSLRNNLAARGGLSSGEDAYQTNEQDLSYSKAQNQALQSLLAAINGYNQTYTTNQQNEQAQLTSGMQQALQNQEALGTAVPTMLHYNAKTGKYDSGSGGTYKVSNNTGKVYLTSEQTGQRFLLNPNGTLSAV